MVSTTLDSTVRLCCETSRREFLRTELFLAYDVMESKAEPQHDVFGFASQGKPENKNEANTPIHTVKTLWHAILLTYLCLQIWNFLWGIACKLKLK